MRLLVTLSPHGGSDDYAALRDYLSEHYAAAEPGPRWNQIVVDDSSEEELLDFFADEGFAPDEVLVEEIP